MVACKGYCEGVRPGVTSWLRMVQVAVSTNTDKFGALRVNHRFRHRVPMIQGGAPRGSPLFPSADVDTYTCMVLKIPV